MLVNSAFQKWKYENKGYPQSEAALSKGVCKNATPLVCISWFGDFSESIKKEFSNTLGGIFGVHKKDFREQYAQGQGNCHLNGDSWASDTRYHQNRDTSYYHSGNNCCHFDNTPNATPACKNNQSNHNGYEKRNTKRNSYTSKRNDNLCHPVMRLLLCGMGLVRYIGDLSKNVSGQASRHTLAFFVPTCCASQATHTTGTKLLPSRVQSAHSASYDGVTLQNTKPVRGICRAVTYVSESEPCRLICLDKAAITQNNVGGQFHA